MENASAASAAKKQKLIRIAVIAGVAALVVGAVIFFTVQGVRSMRGANLPAPTQSVIATEAPDAEYELMTYVRYWPEDADYASCDYACPATWPVFSRTQTAGAAMNAAVDEYVEALYARIESSYMPASVAQPPYTEVGCEVRYFEGFTEVIFTEQHCYEAQPYTETHVLVMDGRGKKVNMNDVFRTYHADELIASAVLEKLAESGSAYEGLALTDVIAKLDIANRCLADENGVTAYFSEGALAPYELGELAVTVPASCLLPDFVGEALTAEEYENISRLADHLATACMVRGTDVENGELTAYAASAFMGSAINARGYVSSQGRIIVPAGEFESFYRGCFGHDFPGIDTDGFNIKTVDGGYSVYAQAQPYEYHLDMFSAARSGDAVTITGDVIFDAFGSPYTQVVCHATLTLVKNGESPFGFTVIDYILSL